METVGWYALFSMLVGMPFGLMVMHGDTAGQRLKTFAVGLVIGVAVMHGIGFVLGLGDGGTSITITLPW